MKTSFRLLLAVVGFCGLVSSTWSRDLPNATPEEVGLSSDRLARLSAVMQDYVESERVAGGVAIILRQGQVAYHHAFGMADREAGAPMQTDTIFRIASMTKAVTSLAVMMLFEQGHFMLDDRVSRYLPEFDREMKVMVRNEEAGDDGEPYTLEPARDPITIRHLLTHTSGLTYGFHGQKYIAGIYEQAGVSDGLVQTEGTIGEMVEKLVAQPLVNQPGKAWQYGLSTDVLGYLVEVVSGMPLDQYFREYILQPLQMQDTHFFLPADKVARLATVYTPDDEGGIKALDSDGITMGSALFSTTYHHRGPRTYFSGGAGLVSTSGDYARFLQMLLNGGELDGVRLLSPKTVQLMTSNQLRELKVSNLPGIGFSLGFSVDLGPDQSGQIGSEGLYSWGGFFNTGYWVDPIENLVAVLMTQRFPNDDSDILGKFRVMTYQAVVE